MNELTKAYQELEQMCAQLRDLLTFAICKHGPLFFTKEEMERWVAEVKDCAVEVRATPQGLHVQFLTREDVEGSDVGH